MKRSRIKVGAIWPHEGMHLRIQTDLIEKLLISERAVQRSRQHRLKINFADKAIAKRHTQAIRPNNVKACDAVKCVNHAGTYGSGSIGKGSVPACNRTQSASNSG